MHMYNRYVVCLINLLEIYKKKIEKQENAFFNTRYSILQSLDDYIEGI